MVWSVNTMDTYIASDVRSCSSDFGGPSYPELTDCAMPVVYHIVGGGSGMLTHARLEGSDGGWAATILFPCNMSDDEDCVAYTSWPVSWAAWLLSAMITHFGIWLRDTTNMVICSGSCMVH